MIFFAWFHCVYYCTLHYSLRCWTLSPLLLPLALCSITKICAEILKHLHLCSWTSFSKIDAHLLTYYEAIWKETALCSLLSALCALRSGHRAVKLAEPRLSL